MSETIVTKNYNKYRISYLFFIRNAEYCKNHKEVDLISETTFSNLKIIFCISNV